MSRYKTYTFSDTTTLTVKRRSLRKYLDPTKFIRPSLAAWMVTAKLNTSDLGCRPPRAIFVVLTKTDAAPHPMANCFRGMLDLILGTNVNAACFPKRAHQENGYDNSNHGSP